MTDFLATTTMSDVSNVVKTFYDKVLLETLDPELKYYQFAEKKPVPKGEGSSVYWNQAVKFDVGRILTEGQPATISAGRNLSTTRVSAIVNQYGDWCGISDLADYTAMIDLGRMAAERLGAQAAKTIDRVIANAILFNVSASGRMNHFRFKTSTEVTDYYGMASTISAGIMTVSATNILAVSDIRGCVFELRRLAVKPYSGQDYIGILPVESMEDIAGDSTFTAFHQYVDKGVDALYNGEMGKIYGCRLIAAPNGPCVRGSNYGATASSVGYVSMIFGKGFYGATEWDGGIKTYISKGASKSDPLNQMAVYGWKANFAAKVLDPSCGVLFVAGSRDTTTAYAESASSGLRFEDPSTY